MDPKEKPEVDKVLVRDPENYLDIDTPEDLEFAEQVLSGEPHN